MKSKKRHLRPEIKAAIDKIEMAAITLFASYCFAQMFLFMVGIDL